MVFSQEIEAQKEESKYILLYNKVSSHGLGKLKESFRMHGILDLN